MGVEEVAQEVASAATAAAGAVAGGSRAVGPWGRVGAAEAEHCGGCLRPCWVGATVFAAAHLDQKLPRPESPRCRQAATPCLNLGPAPRPTCSFEHAVRHTAHL